MSCWGLPPDDGTRSSPVLSAGPNTIVSSSPQVPPRGWEDASAIGVGAPPATAAVISFARAKKPTRLPSGEKKGGWAPSLSGTTLASKRSSALT